MSTPADNKPNDFDPVHENHQYSHTDPAIPSNRSPLRVRAIKLETVRDVRKFLSRLINKTYRDEVSPVKAGRLGQLAGILVKTIELADIERRISELEEIITTHEDFPPSD
jgi:hypothetical protein